MHDTGKGRTARDLLLGVLRAVLVTEFQGCFAFRNMEVEQEKETGPGERSS
jgi:hypothetical protein